MYLAYLILAHKNPQQLERLIDRLGNGEASIHVHLDQKSEDRQFFYSLASRYKNLSFIRHQANVNWGAFSMIEATLYGIDEILQQYPGVSYICLLSGQDYPVKSSAQFFEFLSENHGKEFIYNRESPSPDLPLGGRDRYEYYYSYDSLIQSKDAYEKEMQLRGQKREFIRNLRPFHGAQWWCLTGSCAAYVLRRACENTELMNYYRYTKFPDEQFFQTVIMNSEYAANLYNDTLTYIDWSHLDWSAINWTDSLPHPKTLTAADYGKLLATNKFFARKFDTAVDSTILDLIDHSLLFRC